MLRRCRLVRRSRSERQAVRRSRIGQTLVVRTGQGTKQKRRRVEGVVASRAENEEMQVGFLSQLENNSSSPVAKETTEF